MTDLTIDYSQIRSENIPLSVEEINAIEKEQKTIAKKLPTILAACTFFTMALIAYFIRDNFSQFKYYDYILFFCAGLALFGFCYLITWLINRFDTYKWRKDKPNGKVKLTTVIIDRDKTEYGEYLSFAVKPGSKKIRVQVNREDYNYYKIGTTVIVTYLQFSKKALTVVELNKN